MGTVMHASEGDIVCRSTNEKIPYFNAPIFLENKSQVGKVDEILGPVNEVVHTSCLLLFLLSFFLTFLFFFFCSSSPLNFKPAWWRLPSRSTTSFSSAPTVFFPFLASFPSPRSHLAACPRPAVVAGVEVLEDVEERVEVLAEERVEVLAVEDHAVGSVAVAVVVEEASAVVAEVVVDVEDHAVGSVEAVEVKRLFFFLFFLIRFLTSYAFFFFFVVIGRGH